jgi:Cu-Zn family superoxide dismutase
MLCSPLIAVANPLSAQAVLSPTAGNQVTGTVSFEQVADNLRVSARIEGLAPGPHGFHIHQNGDCSAADASSAGGHFNPGATAHGDPAHGAHHGGDFGNIVADASGVAKFQITVPVAQINLVNGNPAAVLNRAVIVHAAPDDLVTQPTGNSGARVACGVIALK